MSQLDSYSGFLPLGQSSSLTNESVLMEGPKLYAQPDAYSQFLPQRHSSKLITDDTMNGTKVQLHSQFLPLRQSSKLADETLPMDGTNIHRDSYAHFHPLRQSSLLTDDTLPMNGTNVWANISVQSSLASTLPNSHSSIMTNDSDQTLWTTALDVSPQDELPRTFGEVSEDDTFHTVLDLTQPQVDEVSLDDTLPMDNDVSFNGTFRINWNSD